MNREQVKELFKIIKMSYSNFEVSSEKIDFWHSILQDYDFNEIRSNLINHIEVSRYAPVISELLQKPVKEYELPSGPAVPDVEETKAYLKKFEEIQPASPEVREKALAEIREKLGIRK